MNFKSLQEEYLERLRVAGYSPRTLKHIRIDTNDFLEYLHRQNIDAPSEITVSAIHDYQAELKARKISSVYLANKYTDSRRFLSFLHEQGWTIEDYGLAFGKVRKIKSQRAVLTQGEVAELLLRPNIETRRGIRDRALLELLYSSALRREEAVRIELYDLNMIEGLVKVTGKGNKQRIVPVGKIALHWLYKYIKEVRGSYAKDPHLFVGLQTKRKMSVEHLGFVVKACSGKKKITPHALRHACATHMMQEGASSTMIQIFLGHEQLMTTEIYTHVLTEDLKNVMDRFHPRKWLNVSNFQKNQEYRSQSFRGSPKAMN